jgi:hypothetical protein
MASSIEFISLKNLTYLMTHILDLCILESTEYLWLPATIKIPSTNPQAASE